MQQNNHIPEILAPAGDFDVFQTAINAGADAVYLGLKQFNARRGARNFSAQELEQAVHYAHERQCKVYLTLNIDLAQRELNQALHAVVLADSLGVDGILIRDPALLALIPYFPKLSFHFSTQAAISSSAGMNTAQLLGIRRVVLARELTREEIRACAQVNTVETEIFVQGAMCYSISGRCLMSSWVGGRSGNRGTCASPCRVPWGKAKESTECHPFSMHDLSLVPHIDELAQMGVDSLKIEGRLKQGAWVQGAIQQFKEKAAKTDVRLGHYTGREQTDGYYTGERDQMVGESGRIAASENTTTATDVPEDNAQDTLHITLHEDEKKGLNFLWVYHNSYGTFTGEMRMPFRPVKKAKKAMTLADLMAALTIDNTQCSFDTPPLDFEMLLVPTSCNNVINALTLFVRNARKEPDTTLKNPIPDAVKNCFDFTPNPKVNNKPLGTVPNRVRIDRKNYATLVAKFPQITYIIPCESCADAQEIASATPQLSKCILSLPCVIYEAMIPEINKLLEWTEAHKVTVEINNWDALSLVQKYSLTYEAGPGLAVLNAMAAHQLNSLGFRSVYVAPESDQIQIETLCEKTDTPLSIINYGYPPLFYTRLVPQPCFASGEILTDSRGNTIRAHKEGDLWVYRPTQPFSWIQEVNPKIQALHYVADLSGATAPLEELTQIMAKKTKEASIFNYKRNLR